MLSYLSLYYWWVEWKRDEERLLTTIYKSRREREEWSWATFPAKTPPHSSPDLSASISLLSAHPTPLPPLPLSIQCSRQASSIHITWEPVRNQKLGLTRVPWSQNLQFSRTPGDPCAITVWEPLWRTKGGVLPGDWDSPEPDRALSDRWDEDPPCTLSPEPSSTSGSVPGPASQQTDKASLRHQLNQEPAHFCTDSRVEWGTGFSVAHTGVAGAGPPVIGARKRVSPWVSGTHRKNWQQPCPPCTLNGQTEGMLIKCPVECYLPTLCLSEEIFWVSTNTANKCFSKPGGYCVHFSPGCGVSH